MPSDEHAGIAFLEPYEIAKLPRWALVALLSRMGRRLQHIISAAPTKLWKDEKIYVEHHLSAAEKSARAGSVVADPHPAFVILDGPKNPTLKFVESVFGIANRNTFEASIEVSEDLKDAFLGAIAINEERGNKLRDGVLFDYALLWRLTQENKWTNKSPVDPDLCGPLWRGGDPLGPRIYKKGIKPPAELPPPRIHVEFSVPADCDDEEVERIVEQLLLRANELHLALGGEGLVIAESQSYEPASVEEPVGGCS